MSGHSDSHIGWASWALKLLLLAHASFSQVLTYERAQPELLIPKLADCCKQPTEVLFECSKNVSRDLSVSSFTLVSYLTRNIIDYAKFSTAVNIAYAEQNQYSFEITSPETGDEFDKTDQRWNKVKIVEKMLSQNRSGIEYVIWLDSDLIIVDLGMKLELIVQEYPDSDVIISLDADPEGIYSIVNTGFIIVRCSEWSKDFFKTWWGDTTRRSMGTDQHVFTEIWNNGDEIFRSHIQLLAPDAINTKRPATENHQPYNQVIHMVGSIPAHRIAVFRSAFACICHSVEHKLPLQRQLGVTRLHLQEIENDVLSNRSILIDELSSQLQDTERNKTTVSKLTLLQLRSKLDIVMRICEKTLESDLDPLQHLSYNLYLILKQYCSKSDEEVLQITIEVGFEFASLESSERSVRVLLELEYFVAQLISILEAKGKDIRPGKFYKFKRFQLLGIAYGKIADSRINSNVSSLRQLQIEAFRYSLFEWDLLRSELYFGSNSGIFNPYEEAANMWDIIGCLKCLQEEYKDAEEAFMRSRALFEGYLFTTNESNLRTVNHIPKSFALSYLQMMNNAGMCYMNFNITASIQHFYSIEEAFLNERFGFPASSLSEFDIARVSSKLLGLRDQLGYNFPRLSQQNDHDSTKNGPHSENKVLFYKKKRRIVPS